jgi:hypothetical protein
MLNIPIDGQEVFEEQIDILSKKMEDGTAEFPPNWSLMGFRKLKKPGTGNWNF